MKRKGILNRELSEAIASMGHGDMLVVCDAGYPIPEESWRVDLALAPNMPDLQTVLALISDELVTEKVIMAEDLKQNNAALYGTLLQTFDEEDFELTSNEKMLFEVPQQAKAIVRTGAFDPWGNIGLVSGIDVSSWFSGREDLIVPEHYRLRLDRERG